MKATPKLTFLQNSWLPNGGIAPVQVTMDTSKYVKLETKAGIIELETEALLKIAKVVEAAR
jgi:phage tail tube protein FII